MKVAVGSTRKAKIIAVRESIERNAAIDTAWREADILSLDVKTETPAMPITDEQLMQGAMSRAETARTALLQKGIQANLSVGLEGGFHTVDLNGQHLTFLRGWAYVTDGAQGSFGASPSIIVPQFIVKPVVEDGRELGLVIDEIVGKNGIRSRQGTWGILSRDLLTRAMSFESALIAALAPFYNKEMYA